ncbi:MAG: flagellin-like protein [Alphaproteobacteria bacterium]|nr:flagellin-like protein [Alphaproteobacteria bacterium]
MAENVSLSSAVRANLLSLQTTTELIARTQGRLSTGLRVASAVDDAVSFFQAKSLNDRAADFEVKKRGIDQGISTITAAADAVTAIENLVNQLKGLILTAKSATTSTEIDNLVSQFNDLRSQVNNLAADASYQGLNLVNGTGQALTVNFSNDTASVLSVNSYDLRASRLGLNVAKLSAYSNTTGIMLNRAYISAGTITAAMSTAISTASTLQYISFTVGGQSAATVELGDSFTITYDGLSFSANVLTGISGAVSGSNKVYITAGTYAVGTSINLRLVTGSNAMTGVFSKAFSEITATYDFHGFEEFSGGILMMTGTSLSVTETEAIRAVGVGFTTEYNARITNLDSALTTLRSRAQTLGSNIALLQTRLDFTKAYATTLSTGSGKLTLADLNEEGANLLALQTRQQLGIQSLAFAGQAEQTILTLFR